MTSLIDPRQGRKRSALRRHRRWRGPGSVIEYDSLVGLSVLERVMLTGPARPADGGKSDRAPRRRRPL